MTRRIVQLAGSGAQWALADDGSLWFWTGQGWIDAGRGNLPEVETGPVFGSRTWIAPTETAKFVARTETLETQLPPKRGPGRPRKNP